MTTTIKTLKRLFGLEPRISREQAMAAFGRRYASFNELLQSCRSWSVWALSAGKGAARPNAI